MDKYTVYLNETAITRLNHLLALRQNISDEQLEALKTSHVIAYLIKEEAKKHMGDPLTLKMLAGVFDALETEQQKLWNFNPDPNYHRWFDFPGCTCPKIDNLDYIGSDIRIYDSNCPIHGHKSKLDKKEPT